MAANLRKPTIERIARPRANSEADALLLMSINYVLTKIAGGAERKGSELVERAYCLRDVVLDWQLSPPSDDERDDITAKVLELHIKLSALLRSQRAKS